MQKKNYIKFIIFIFFLFIFIPNLIIIFSINNINNFDLSFFFTRNYQLTGANITIELQSNGKINLSENIGYKFNGCYREVYREPNMPIKQYFNGPYINDFKAFCIPDCKIENRGYEISGNFGTICDRDALFSLNYIIHKGIVIGNDISEFHYKIWGKEWNKNVIIEGFISLPENLNEENIDIFFNPKGIVKEYYFQENKVFFKTKKFNNFLEVRILMPKESFNYVDSNSDIFIFNENFKREDSLRNQKRYNYTYLIYYSIFFLFIIPLFLSLVFIPIFLFRKYGREPQISYSAVFEREPIKNIKPYILNSICMGKIGMSTKDIVPALLLDLIRRKFIILEENKTYKTGFFKDKLDLSLLLKFIGNDNDFLTPTEQKVYSFFKGKSKDDILIWQDFINSLKIESNAREYIKLYSDLDRLISKEYDIKEYFDSKGNIIWKSFSFFVFVIGVIILFFNDIIKNLFPSMNYLSLFSFILVIYGLIGLFLSEKIFGRFSLKGYEIYNKTINYEKFLTDMTLLKKYPPSSIVIWEEHLVYATIFGVAKKVISEFKSIVPESYQKRSSLFYLTNNTHFSSFSNSYVYASSTISSSSSSGGGSVGGGFGGGGGGAR
jgi:uncharacterized membrane protein